MSFSNVLALVLAIVKAVGSLLPLPDFTNALAFRTWALALVAVLKEAVALTSIKVDDDAVEVLDKIVSNDDTFAAFADLVANLVTDSGKVAALAAGAIPAQAAAIASKLGISPTVVAAIVAAIVQAIKLIIELRDRPQAAAA